MTEPSNSQQIQTASKPLGIGVGYMMVIMVAFLWAIGLVGLRGFHETIPPFGISFWRWTAAAVGLLPFAIANFRGDFPAIKANWRYFSKMAFCMVGASALSAVALNFTTAVNATLVNASQPTMTAVVAWALISDKLNKVQSLGILAAAFGIAVMVSRADISVLTNFQFNIGDIVMLIAVVGYALYAVGIHDMPKGIKLTSAVFAVFVFGVLELLPFYLVESIVYMPVPFDLQTIGVILFLGIITSTIPVFMWSRAIPVVGVNRAAIFINLIPVFGAVLAVTLLGEKLFTFHFIGALFICIGILLVIRRSKT
ncbi:MAG: DMT family transporter [Rhodospirillales bacterium]|nr:DMT family transporter [Rhodospirillales bacterium]